MSIADRSGSNTHTPLQQPSDRLNRAEFERRYRAIRDCKKAELIEGIVYVPSPARLRHGEPHALLMTWCVNYSNETLVPNLQITSTIDWTMTTNPNRMLRYSSIRRVAVKRGLATTVT